MRQTCSPSSGFGEKFGGRVVVKVLGPGPLPYSPNIFEKIKSYSIFGRASELGPNPFPLFGTLSPFTGNFGPIIPLFLGRSYVKVCPTNPTLKLLFIQKLG